MTADALLGQWTVLKSLIVSAYLARAALQKLESGFEPLILECSVSKGRKNTSNFVQYSKCLKSFLMVTPMIKHNEA